MLQAVENHIRLFFQQWMQKRLPAAKTITLNQQRLFIFPSSAGVGFLITLIVILLVAINYQNNMVFALSFLLVSVFIVTILHTYANLSGLSLTVVRAYPAFVGDTARFDIKISRQTRRQYFDITVRWPSSETHTISLREHSELIVSLHLSAGKRGLLTPPRLLVETHYPLGLLRCWTKLALDAEALVYPKPIPCKWQTTVSSDNDNGEAILAQGSDDFYTFKSYQPGDPLKHLAWKHYAKGQPLQTKQFAAYREQRYWLEWNMFYGDAETRLSSLCYWVLQLEKRGEEYGLRIPGIEINPNNGEQHRTKVLRALALFDAHG